MERLALPSSMTLLGNMSFANAKIDELILLARSLRTVGRAFVGFHTRVLDLREAADVTEVHVGCFEAAVMKRMLLPLHNRHFSNVDLSTAKIEEHVRTRRR